MSAAEDIAVSVAAKRFADTLTAFGKTDPASAHRYAKAQIVSGVAYLQATIGYRRTWEILTALADDQLGKDQGWEKADG